MQANSEENIISLTEIRPDTNVTVHEITSQDPKLIKKFSSLGIIKGAHMVLKKSKSPMVLEVAGTKVALGRSMAEKVRVKFDVKKLVLVGNPNVGKSVIFTRLTGIKAVSSNFPGTTIALKHSTTGIGSEKVTVFDVPGIYNLEACSKADKEACEIVLKKDYDVMVCVLDAHHFERSLYFALEALALGKPTLFLINKYKSAKAKGITIDPRMVSKILKTPTVVVEGLSGEGFKTAAHAITKLLKNLTVFETPKIPATDEGKWKLIGEIVTKAQTLKHKHPSMLEMFAEWCTRPLTGLPIAAVILTICFFIIRFAGETAIDTLTPLYENYYLPFITSLFADKGMLTVILVGGGSENSFGILTDALQIALIDVMSYVIAFYAILEFLADLGYLPRLSVLLDSMLHKVGIHGYGAIPIIMGLGCKVPAVMGIRILESKREKFIALVLLLMLAPCISQSAMIITILSPHGLKYVAMVFGILLITGLASGAFLNKIMKGNPPDMFMEIPAWQMPKIKDWLIKVWYRIKEYLFDAVPLIIFGIFLINIAEMTGVLDWLAKVTQAPMQALFGLPGETSSVMLLGFLRKDVSIALLSPFNLTAAQLVTACVFMTMYVPCTATVFVMLKEAGIKQSVVIIAFTLAISTAVASAVHFLFLI
ncbi:Putative indolepyruvate ferredoxin oxidoreductase [Elusimicrobium minutum Pei191]|uniref:Putative indolepyruvate ferredoxin oxidoreductase n=1 Tax=Elusimicrobium minutum (strain Pei191) TaxID=445932 RepID=B2KDM9_ELUMP|nr:FeoB small GTPase domain-containing protein [Elusimicrobium minutum]ACC98625.1 Putative indolepyruvate ferredoxin oxidoreductase [Elusimicrobium minutum Pei191]